VQYVPVAGGFALLVGFSELRLGTKRTAFVTVTAQLVGVLGAAALLWLLRGTDWTWAKETATTLDVGFSAGAVGALAAASATLRAPWRGRVRGILLLYIAVTVVLIGVLWDVEHLLAVLYALPLGAHWAGQPLRPRMPRVGRRETRLVAATLFWIAAALVLLGAVITVTGPLGRFGQPGQPWAAVLVSAGLDIALGFGLRRGRHSWWLAALVITLASLAFTGLALAVTLLGGLEGSGMGLIGLVLILDVFQAVVLVGGRRAFRNPGRRGRRRAGTGRIGAANSQDAGIAARHDLIAAGSPNRLSWMTVWPENSWWFAPSGRGYLAHRVHAGVAIGLADPIGPTPADRAEVLDSFIDAVGEAALTPCVFSATREVVEQVKARGWLALQVAEEAVIDLPALEFKGKKWQDVRSALNQAGKQGITFQLVTLAQAPKGLQAQVRAISEEWVGDKGLPEMGFTLGGVEEAMDPEVLVGLAVDAESKVHGVTSWMPIHEPGGRLAGYTLDVMRRLPDGFRYTMEFLISSAAQAFKAQGLDVVSLSGAPLARTTSPDQAVDATAIDSMLEQLGSALEPYYGFRSLNNFKAKFLPRHEPLYLVVPDEGVLPRVGIALGRAYLPDVRVRDLPALVSTARPGA
jgi:phosphatidylglycerol lysyltransferase